MTTTPKQTPLLMRPELVRATLGDPMNPTRITRQTSVETGVEVTSGAGQVELQPYVEYYEGRSESWKWVDGKEHWWEKFIVWLNGWDGLGQPVCERRWRWNGSKHTLRTDYVHLTDAEVSKLLETIAAGRADAERAAV